MVEELAQTIEIVLEEKSDKELREIAKDMDLKLAPALGRKKMIQAIKNPLSVPKIMEADKTVTETVCVTPSMQHDEQSKVPTIDITVRPCFEEVAINGGIFNGKKYPKSKRVFVYFRNLQDSGMDERFLKGRIKIHIYECDKDGKMLVNVLPECLIDKITEDFRHISLARKGTPIFKDRINPQSGEIRSELSGSRPKYDFVLIGDAPEDAPLGLWMGESPERT